MNWTLLDYIAALVLVSGLLGGIWLAFRLSRSSRYRQAATVALLAAFLLAWVNGAVGIIGDDNNDANLMFVFVLGALAAGAVLVRLRARGMARVLIVIAVLQAVVAAIALVLDLGAEGNRWPLDVLVATVILCGMWLASASLFNAAAHERPGDLDGQMDCVES